jgi:hypothetical protein
MPPVSDADILDFVQPKLDEFHKRRIESLLNLKLDAVLARKNPYLFRVKNITTAQDLVRSLLDAHLSSQEESIFGEFLEQLAVFVCKRAFCGRKSPAEGIDIEFERDGVLYLVAVKSGPNWANSQQIVRLKDTFRKAKRILRSSGYRQQVVAINGCCYGRDRKPDKGDYFKLCGQSFWELLSGDSNFYTRIVEPLGYKAKERNEQFNREYPKVVNRFTREFTNDFCAPDGSILWDKLVRFNSGTQKTLQKAPHP